MVKGAEDRHVPRPEPGLGATVFPVQLRSQGKPGSNDTLQLSPRHLRDGHFDGSFAGSARLNTTIWARPWYRRKEYFTVGWTDPSIWRAAVVEGAATAMLAYISGQFGMSILNSGTQHIIAYVGIFGSVLPAVFIYAAAPASGGHINPLVTWSTFWCGLCPAARAVAYIVLQTLGGALGGGALRGSWGYEKAAANMGGGCFFDPNSITPGQVFLTEAMCSFILIFLGFGTGLDPRQALVFGPQLGPILVGLCLGTIVSATAGIAEGYTGANMNPTRCLALSVARGSFSYHWIWWVGPALAGLVNACLYTYAPPYHVDREKEKHAAEDSVA